MQSNRIKIYKNKYIFISVIGIIFSFVLFGGVRIDNRTTQKVKVAPTASLNDYNNLRIKYLTILKRDGINQAIESIKKDSEKDQNTLYYCHDLMHEVGKEAYLKLNDFSKAASYEDPSCVSGYIHGVLQEYFSENSDIKNAMYDACKDHRKEDYFAWECYHGVGHGLMYFSENNLPESIGNCASYQDLFAQSACTNGAYMENFSADGKIHPTKFRKASDSFYPCSEQREEYKSGCYQNAPIYYLSLHENDYESALDWCDKAENDFKHVCYSGVGSQATRRNVKDLNRIESICESGNKEQKEWCLVGFVNYYTGHFGNIKEAERLCSKLEKRNQEVCNEAVEIQKKLFL